MSRPRIIQQQSAPQRPRVVERTTIDQALVDHNLLGAALGDPSTWATWLVILRSAFGLALNDQQLAIFHTVAGARAPPTKRVRELWAIVGRRGGKSRMAAAIAIFLAIFCRYKLAAGEKGMVLVLAASVEQAKVVFAYAKAFLTESPILSREVDSITRTEIRLRNGLAIAIHPNSFRTVRGRTLCATIFDEVAIWRSEESALPDAETYSAVLPSLLTTKGMLIGISTGYRRVGLLYQKHRDFYGIASDDTLVVQGSTLTFNGSLTEADLAAQRAADPSAASSEWDGSFRDDLASYLDDALIEAAIDHGRPLELPPRLGVFYKAFTDPSGGVGADSYTVCIAHKENGRFIVDLVRGTHGQYDPVTVTQQYAALLKEYRIQSVVGDHYAAQWVQGAWRTAGIAYTTAELAKSDIYLETIPLFARGLVQLPDHPKLLRELRLLERRTHRSGKDSVDHPRNGRDDFANSVCGALRNLSAYLGYDTTYAGWQDEPDEGGQQLSWEDANYLAYVSSGGMLRLF